MDYFGQLFTALLYGAAYALVGKLVITFSGTELISSEASLATWTSHTWRDSVTTERVPTN